MENKLKLLMEKFIITDKYSEFLNELFNIQSIEFDQIVSCVMNHLNEIQNETKINELAAFIGSTCFTKQSLINIDYQIRSLNDDEENSSKKIFLKKVLKQIGDLITKAESGRWEFAAEYARLSSMAMFW